MTPEEGVAWKSPNRDAPRRAVSKMIARLFKDFTLSVRPFKKDGILSATTREPKP